MDNKIKQVLQNVLKIVTLDETFIFSHLIKFR
jgi:hypothetical protein